VLATHLGDSLSFNSTWTDTQTIQDDDYNHIEFETLQVFFIEKRLRLKMMRFYLLKSILRLGIMKRFVFA
jgi:hypothetical protein